MKRVTFSSTSLHPGPPIPPRVKPGSTPIHKPPPPHIATKPLQHPVDAQVYMCVCVVCCVCAQAATCDSYNLRPAPLKPPPTIKQGKASQVEARLADAKKGVGGALEGSKQRFTFSAFNSNSNSVSFYVAVVQVHMSHVVVQCKNDQNKKTREKSTRNVKKFRIGDQNQTSIQKTPHCSIINYQARTHPIIPSHLLIPTYPFIKEPTPSCHGNNRNPSRVHGGRDMNDSREVRATPSVCLVLYPHCP